MYRLLSVSGSATVISFLGDFLDAGTANLDTTSSNDVVLNQCTLSTSSVNAITGTGSVKLNGVNFSNSSGIAGTVNINYSSTFESGTLFTQNISFDRGATEIDTDGQLVIGS